MGTPQFRYSPTITQVLSKLSAVNDAAAHDPLGQVLEELHRRDVELEDWLRNYGGGREYDTVVVAAQDTHIDGKRRANFVCNGANDVAILQEAADSLTANGGQVVLLEGSYSGVNEVVSGRTGYVAIRGMGLGTRTLGIRFTTFAWLDGLYITNADAVNPAVLNTSLMTRCSISGIVSGAVGVNTAASSYGTGDMGMTMYGCQITGDFPVSFAGQCSILASQIFYSNIGILQAAASVVSTRLIASGVSFEAYGADPTGAISLNGTTNSSAEVEITNNTFHASASASLVPRYNILGASLATGRHVISGNTFGPTREHQIKLSACSNGGLITGNQFAGLASTVSNTYDNIHLDANTDKWAIIGNQVGVDGGNQRNNVRVNSSDCDANHVIVGLNDFRNAVTADLTDNGTATIKTIPAGSLPTPTITVRKNSGANVGTRPRINFIEGSNVTLTVADDGVDNEVDVTVAGATPAIAVRKNSGANVGTRPRINLIEGSNVTLTVADDGVDNEVDVTVAASAGPDVQVFTANGTWTKPSAGQTRAKVIAIGGGGGGGSGRKGAAGSARYGGGGGGGAAYLELEIPLSALSATQAATVGAGGAGGTGASADSTDGSAGTAGGSSSFAGYPAVGGSAGGAGTAASAAGGAGGAGGWFSGGAGGASAAGAPSAGVAGAAAGGGGGGGISAADAAASGAAGAASLWGTAGGAGG